MTRTVLVGASGWLGTYLRSSLGEVDVVSARAVIENGEGALEGLLSEPSTVVVNAAGARGGPDDVMARVNGDLPKILARAAERAGGHLVHLGSAAEYGIRREAEAYGEDDVPAPVSAYGTTKLAGTQAALDTGCATVLRVFNVAASPPQDGSPLSDVVERIRSGAPTGVVQLWSAATVRDWVPVTFVVESVRRAVQIRPVGLFNVCSGHGVRMGDAAARALALAGTPAEVVDLAASPATVVVGRPDRWRASSDLVSEFGTEEMARMMSSAAFAAHTPADPDRA